MSEKKSPSLGYSIEFWCFPNRVWRAVDKTCLQLQNDYDLDVILLLFCIWFAWQKGSIPQPLLDQAIAFSKVWNPDIVQSLRKTRKCMQDRTMLLEGMSSLDYEFMLEEIKNWELKAEFFQQQRLHWLANQYCEERDKNSYTYAEDNLQRYCKTIKAKVDPVLLQTLPKLLDFDELFPEESEYSMEEG